MTDDYSSDIHTTGMLTAGGSATGNFETLFDQDSFKIALRAGTTYLFKMSGAPDGGGTLSSYDRSSLELLNQAGTTQSLLDVGLFNGATLKQYTPAVSGTYYLLASSWLYTGSYTLSATSPSADDYPASIATSGVIDVGAPARGTFERAKDVDWFKFHAEAGQHYRVEVIQDGDIALGSAAAFDANGKMVANDVAYKPFEPSSTGDYYLALSASSVGAYTAKVRVLTDDYSANDTVPGQLAAGGTASGALQYDGDGDRFKLDMVEGQFYTIALKPSTAQGSGRYMSLDVLAPSPGGGSATYAHIDGSGVPLSLTVKATATGSYWVDVAGRPDNGPVPVSYTLTASAAPDDYADDRDGAAALPVGAVMRGSLQTGTDIDVVKLALTAGVSYSFTMPQNPSSDVRVQLYGSDGSVVHGSSNGPGSASFGYTPDTSGTYYLSMGDWYNRGANTATDIRYAISTARIDNDVSANADTTARLAADGSYQGKLNQSSGDRDWVGLDMTAGTTYVVTLDGQYATQLSLKDAAGNQLALPTPQTYGLPAKMLYYTAADSGRYYIEVAAGDREAGTAYRLNMTSFVDDYGNDSAHAGALAFGSTVDGALELASDVDVFHITLHADEFFSIDFSSPQPGGSPAQHANGNGPTLQIVDSSGKALLPFNSAEGQQDPHQVFLSTTYGEYYVKVLNTGDAPAPASYTLVPTLLHAGDDIGSGPAYSSPLALGQLLTSAVDNAFDADTFKIHVGGSGNFTVALGAAAGAVKLEVIDSDGRLLAPAAPAPGQGGDDTDHTVASYAAHAAGDYYLTLTSSLGHSVPVDYWLLTTFAWDDVTAPQLRAASIANGATGVALHPKLTLTFNETIQAGTGPTLTDDHGVTVTAPGDEALFSVSGNTLQLNPHVLLHPGTTYTLALPQDSVLDVAGNRYAGPASYHTSFTTVKPAQTGSTGNDLFVGSATGNHIDGGAGIDTVFYDDSQGPLDISLRQGQATVSLQGADTGDTLAGIERLLFPDHALALDIDGHGGQAYRMYQAAFNRAPDLGGLGYWIKAMDDGVSLEQVARSFLASKEFEHLYGAGPNDHDFVTSLYNNVLHRAPDPGGFAYWIDALHNGTDRAVVLNGFSESAENQAALLPIIGQGFPYLFAG